MTPSPLISTHRHRQPTPGVSHWCFDRLAGRISARDSWGNLVMAFDADAQFGQRLAAAFGSTLPQDSTRRVVERRQQPVVRQPLPAAVSLSGLTDTWRTAAVAA